jgi:copper transport protein
MTTSITVVRRAAVTLVSAVFLVLLLAAPGFAHAELKSTDPENGQRLESAPARITMTFSESVNLVDDGINLLKGGEGSGRTVTTPDPTVDGHTITWRMPRSLEDGAYVVTWRVVSADGHPIDGAFAFGIGAAAPVIPDDVADPGNAATTAPWPVVGARLIGYLGFAVVAGVVAFVLWAASDKAGDERLQRLTRGALGVSLAASVLGMLLQGPYTAGLSWSRALDPDLLSATLRTPWGTAMAWRIALLLALAVMIWRLSALVSQPVRWLAPAAVAATAVAIAGAGHGASAGLYALVVDTVHVLTAGVWVGGLVVLVVLGRSVGGEAVRRFSTLALSAVVVLVGTGVLNSLRNIHSLDELFLTRYGVLLLAKLSLVAATLAAASVSRSRVKQARVPGTSVRLEAAMTATVLLVTAFLSMTSPPPQVTLASGVGAAAAPPANALAVMPLGAKGKAGMGVIPANTSGSRLNVLLTDPAGQPLGATAVELEVSNPGRGVAGIPVSMTERRGVWVGRFRFPFSGVWKAVLTVHDRSTTAVVTGGTFTISD